MASYDDLWQLDDIDDLIDDEYAYNAAVGQEVELEKAFGPRMRRAGIAAAVGAAAIGGGALAARRLNRGPISVGFRGNSLTARRVAGGVNFTAQRARPGQPVSMRTMQVSKPSIRAAGARVKRFGAAAPGRVKRFGAAAPRRIRGFGGSAMRRARSAGSAIRRRF